APNASDKDPAAVVEWRKTPWRIVHPGPAPRGDPYPVAVAIRRPADDRRMRKPDGAVVRNRPPAAVSVQVLVADDVIGNVTGGDGPLVPRVAVGAPAVEIVVVAERVHRSRQRVRAGEGSRLIGIQRISGAASGHVAAPSCTAIMVLSPFSSTLIR